MSIATHRAAGRNINLAIPEHAKITYVLADYLRRINHADLNILRRIITLQLDAHFTYHALQFSGFSIDQTRSPQFCLRIRHYVARLEIHFLER